MNAANGRIVGAMLLVASASACGPKVLTPSKPRTACAYCGSAIATGTTLDVMTSWEGVCDTGNQLVMGGSWGGGHSDHREPCNAIPYKVEIACAGDACTFAGRAADADSYEVIPVRAGTLRAQVKFVPVGAGKPRTVDLEPIEVAMPTGVTAGCTLEAEPGFALVKLSLQAASTPLVFDQRSVTVSVKAGAACRTWPDGARSAAVEHFYRCPTTERGTVDIEARGTGFSGNASATCST